MSMSKWYLVTISYNDVSYCRLCVLCSVCCVVVVLFVLRQFMTTVYYYFPAINASSVLMFTYLCGLV
jgi:hypothetical protein